MPMRIELAGESVFLHPDRALFWPRTRCLMVADVHLGKSAALRRQGIAVPEGEAARDLHRLAQLVHHYVPARLLILGDLFHSAVHFDDPWLTAFDDFRARYPHLSIEVLQGNHDRSIAEPTARWALQWHARLEEPPFVLRHEPGQDPRGYVLCGHLHPVMRLRSRLDSLRLPVFWMRDGYAVLPSFGSFTGGHLVHPAAGERAYVATPETVLEIPTGCTPRSPRPPRPLVLH